MSSNERTKELEILKNIQSKLEKIESLEDKLYELNEEINNVSVNESDYDTSHEKRANVQKDQELAKEEDKFISRTILNSLIYIPFLIVSAILAFALLPDSKADFNKLLLLFPIVFPVYPLLIKAKFKDISFTLTIALYIFLAICFITHFSIITSSLLFVIVYIVAIIGIITVLIINAPTKKKHTEACSKIQSRYVPIIEEAKEKDNEQSNKFNSLKEAELETRQKERQPEINKINAEINGLQKEISNLNVLAEKDYEHVDRLIEIIENHDADSINGAFRFMKEEERREEEARAKAPGKIILFVGDYNSATRVYQSVRNAVYIDGKDYGPAGFPRQEYLLEPGVHTVQVAAQIRLGPDEYKIIKSTALSFVLDGSSTKYFQFRCESLVLIGSECNSELDFPRNLKQY